MEVEYENAVKERDLLLAELNQGKINLNNANNDINDLEVAMKVETARLEQCESDNKKRDMAERHTANSALLSKKRKVESFKNEVQLLQMKREKLCEEKDREIKDLLEAHRVEILTANEKIKVILDKKKQSIIEKQGELSSIQGKLDELDLQLNAARKQQVFDPGSL